MAKKIKERESKLVHGTDVCSMFGKNTRIVCFTEDGNRFTIPFRLLFDLVDNYDWKIEKFGQFNRAVEFEPKIEGGGLKLS